MLKSPLVLVFVGAMVCGGDVALAAPGVETCAVTAPRFEPKPRKRPAPEDAKFFGGGKVSHPIAAPCLKRAGEAEV